MSTSGTPEDFRSAKHYLPQALKAIATTLNEVGKKNITIDNQYWTFLHTLTNYHLIKGDSQHFSICTDTIKNMSFKERASSMFEDIIAQIQDLTKPV